MMLSDLCRAEGLVGMLSTYASWFQPFMEVLHGGWERQLQKGQSVTNATSPLFNPCLPECYLCSAFPKLAGTCCWCLAMSSVFLFIIDPGLAFHSPLSTVFLPYLFVSRLLVPKITHLCGDNIFFPVYK